MSVNWVMLNDNGQGFVKLPSERQLFKSPARTSLSITTPKTYPGNDPVSIHCDSGILYLTNQRVVYLPQKPTADFKSFAAPLLNLHDTHVTVPWFGPNAWQAVLQPVPGGNLPASNSGIELKITFKEGGAPDFHNIFVNIKERLQQALEAARESGDLRQSQRAFMNGVNMDAVHLDTLPTYEASGQDRFAPNDEVPPAGPPPPQRRNNNTAIAVGAAAAAATTVATAAVITHDDSPESAVHDAETTNTNQEGFQPPDGPPPGYEETQQQSVQQALDRRLSEHSNH